MTRFDVFRIATCVVALACAPVTHAADGNPAAGKAKTYMCAGCHGIGGYKTVYPEVYHVPKLGGQQAA